MAHALVGLEVNLFVFDASPKPFDKDVVDPSLHVVPWPVSPAEASLCLLRARALCTQGQFRLELPFIVCALLDLPAGTEGKHRGTTHGAVVVVDVICHRAEAGLCEVAKLHRNAHAER